MYKISVDFEKANRNARELEEIASELNRLAQNTCQQVLRDLRQGWKGESARAYLQKTEALQQQMTSTVRDLNTAARNIRNSAQRVYQAELNARRLAEKNG